ncbi:MAG TPA: hypothetical protein VJA21_15680 [Verrucomicrobiae bacterium]
MKNVSGRFLTTAALAVACLLPVATPANQGHHQSGIVGRVQVEQVRLPHFWQVRVATAAFKLVEDIQTDEDGRFTVNLKAGVYHPAPFLAGEGGGVLVGPSVQVSVEKKDFTVVELSLVFGPM